MAAGVHSALGADRASRGSAGARELGESPTAQREKGRVPRSLQVWVTHKGHGEAGTEAGENWLDPRPGRTP